jgi:hypothetical protein
MRAPLPGLYRGRGAFTSAHIDAAPQVVEIAQQARMRLLSELCDFETTFYAVS